jgi:hypothetical protein
MDDYTSNVLNDSKNEWSILLMNYVCPHIIDGFKAIFNESIKLCETNDEIEKYYGSKIIKSDAVEQQAETGEESNFII